jgi:ABC-type polysaccharide/polyol phosphate transport system ATPase subunit
MPCDDIVISFRNVTKTYRIFRHTGERLKQAMTFGLRKYHKEFTALKNVSFDVMKGETIGIIGRNGAGKSTLLQLVCGILKPTSGTVQVNGRISAMLELGAGFNPEFTGRENAYFQGSLMGFTEAQMRDRFDDIEAFADIGDFIDQPVQTYSSGMFMRLAFAVAVHVDPDILIIDEILAVGDIMFQQKCFDLIHRVQSQGTTIVWVSHHPYQIERLCHRATVLEAGQMSDLRPAKEILAKYYELAQKKLTIPSTVDQSSRVGTQELYFEEVRIVSASGGNIVLTTEPLSIVADVFAKFPMDNIRLRFELCSSSNDIIMVFASRGFSEIKQFSGKHRVSFTIDNCQLTSGWYYINAFVVNRHVRLDAWQRAIDFKVLLRDKNAQDISLDQGVFVTHGQWEFSEQLNEGSSAN